MSDAVMIGVGSLGVIFLLIYFGMHISIALGLVSFAGVWLLRGDFGIASSMLAQAASDAIASHVFGVVPLFVMMGFIVAAADLGKDAFEVANQLFRRVRGGLGVATVAANAFFAAITGISIASAAVFTRVAVPPMLSMGYTPRFAVGVVAGSSVLGMLIPPSLLMIIYGFLSGESVGSLFLAGILPGILLATIFALGIVGMAIFIPGFVGGQSDWNDSQALLGIGAMTAKLAPTMALIFICLGGIYSGWFTATEAGAIGSALALVIAIARRKLNWKALVQILIETGYVTVSISFLLICANMYTRLLTLSGMPQYLFSTAESAGLGVVGFMSSYVIALLVLGTIVDSVSILLICMPLALPIAQSFGLDLIWFGIVTILAVEIGLLTPPFGLSAYVVKSTLSDPSITLGDIFVGSVPFVVMMMLTLLLVITFPWISLALVN